MCTFELIESLLRALLRLKGLRDCFQPFLGGQLTKSATPVTQDGLQTDSTLSFPLLSTTLRVNSQQEIKITFMVRSHSPVFSKIFLKMREFITRNLCSFPQKSELQSYRESLCRNSNIKWFYNPDPCTCLPLFFFTVSYWKYWSLTSTCQLICFYHDKIFKAYLLYYTSILIPNLSLDLSIQYFYFFMPHVIRLLFGQGSTTDNYHGATTTASKWIKAKVSVQSFGDPVWFMWC